MKTIFYVLCTHDSEVAVQEENTHCYNEYYKI